MKKLDQYLIREMIVPFLIGTVAVVLMFQANTYIAVGKQLNLDNIPTKAILQYIWFQTPMYLNMTLSVGVSLGSSLAMSRLARESELTAMRAAGVRILRSIVPIIWFGIFVGLFNFYLAERIMPPMSRRATQLGYQIGLIGSMSDLKKNAVVSLQDFTASFGTVHKQGIENLTFENVWLFRQPKPGVEQVYIAKSGRYDHGLWTFDDMRVRIFDGVDVTPAVAAKLTINQRILTDSLFNPPIPEEQTAQDLRQTIDVARQNHVSVKPTEVKYHVRYAVPAACVVFALVGPVFAIVFARSGGFVGVLLSIIMVLIYYNAFVISTEIFSKVDQVPAWLAAWLPNILFALMGALAIRRLE